ncbi:MAG: hypothetical protein J6W75_03090 [Bacteroidaceae bacterium]|nr:hypothetical protein [Bacteroidaceae bacterium]
MKKILLSLLAIFAIGTHAMADEVTVEAVNIPQGKSGLMHVSFNITSNIIYRDFQFDVELPSTISIPNNTDGEPDGTIGNAASTAHQLATSIVDGKARYIANTTTGKTLSSGVLVSIPLTDTDKQAIGTVLEGKLTGVSLSKDDGTSVPFPDVTFSINIVDSRITLDETQSTLDVIDKSTADVLVKRTIRANEWSTLILPFNNLKKAQLEAAFGADAEYATWSGFEVTYAADEVTPVAIDLQFTTATPNARTGLAMNKPYIIKTTKDISEFTADGVTINTTKDETTNKDSEQFNSGVFKGTFVTSTVPTNGIFLSENKFWYSTGLTNIKAFRGWFELDAIVGQSVDLVKVNFFIDGQSTHIAGLQNNSEEGSVYDLGGRKMNSKQLQKGIYIKNGKKVTK